MGRVIIKLRNSKGTYFESFKCKSEDRAFEIAQKYRNLIEWHFYKENERIPKPSKKPKPSNEMTFEQMEYLISRL